MRRAHAGQTPGHDLAAFGHELPEQTVILIVDVGDLFRAELADLLAPEKFAPTFTRRTARARTAAATKAGTVSSSGTLAERPRRPIAGWRWCFCLFSPNAPLNR